MYLIVGLGNPGARYHNTRHNAGFLVIDKLAEFFKIETFEFENNFLYAVTDYNDKQDNKIQVVLMKPLTYMNLSGEAVKYFYDKYEIEKENILIIYDDVNIDLGTLRLRPSGSDGGQNGIKSIIYHMETDEIPRLRFGIKNGEEFEALRSKEDFSLAEFVLSPFGDNELELFEKSIEMAKNAVISFLNFGIKETMNLYNGRIPDKKNGNDLSNEENNTN